MKLLLSKERDSGYDKIHEFYMNPDKKKKLSPKLEFRKALYEIAFSLLCTNKTQKQAADILRRKYQEEISRSTSYRIVSEAMDLFGDIRKANKEGLRQMLIERQMRLAVKAEESGDLMTAEKCYTSVAKMGGLNDVDFDLESIIKNMELPPIHFTTDPEALKVIDITHEEG